MSDGITEAWRGTYFKANKYEKIEPKEDQSNQSNQDKEIEDKKQ